MTNCHILRSSSFYGSVEDGFNRQPNFVQKKIVFHQNLAFQETISNLREDIGKLTMRALKSDQNAQYQLGLVYKNSRHGHGQENLKEAFEWFQIAANQGHMDAQYEIGFMYDYGLGIEHNLYQAKRWYQAAADQDHKGARCHLLYLTQYELYKDRNISWTGKKLKYRNDLFDKSHEKISLKKRFKQFNKSIQSFFKGLNPSNKVRNYHSQNIN